MEEVGGDGRRVGGEGEEGWRRGKRGGEEGKRVGGKVGGEGKRVWRRGKRESWREKRNDVLTDSAWSSICALFVTGCLLALNFSASSSKSYKYTEGAT